MTEESREIVKRQISHPSKLGRKRGAREEEGERRKKMNGLLLILYHTRHKNALTLKKRF